MSSTPRESSPKARVLLWSSLARLRVSLLGIRRRRSTLPGRRNQGLCLRERPSPAKILPGIGSW